MNKVIKQLEDIMVAITFAEAGEFDEACKGPENASAEQVVSRQLPEVKKIALETTGK